jgi:hypothetical protein
MVNPDAPFRELPTRLEPALFVSVCAAEFIRDRLPQRFPKWLAYLSALGVLGTLLWWWLE